MILGHGKDNGLARKLPRLIFEANIHDLLPLLAQGILIANLFFQVGTLEVQLIGAYYCTGTHWTGGCAWTAALAGNCVNIDNPSGTSFSFGPDQGLVCKLFESANCQTGGTVIGGISYPGWADVSAMTQNRGLSVVRSWRCQGEY